MAATPIPSDRKSAHATIRVVRGQQAMVERYPLDLWPEVADKNRPSSANQEVL